MAEYKGRKIWGPVGAAIFSLVCFFSIPSATLAASVDDHYDIGAGDLRVQVANSGQLLALLDRNGTDYLASDQESYILKLVVAESASADVTTTTLLLPEKIHCDKNIKYCKLYFLHEILVDIIIEGKDGYATFELTGLNNPQEKDIRIAMWGPFPVTLYQRVGDVLGVSYSRDYAIGVLGLNPKTLAGAPFEYPQFTHINNIVDPIPVGSEASRTSRNYFSISAARVTNYGSVLQFYSRDYTQERYFKPYDYHLVNWQQPVQPLPDALGSLTGSKIAIYGVARSRGALAGEHLRDVMAAQILDVIGRVEIGEGLPHPIVDGEWAKTSPASRHRYMDVEGLNSNNISEAAELALSAGLGWIYHREGPWGVFKHGGQYPVQEAWGGTDEGLAAAIAIAGKKGVRVGTHTVSGFLRSYDDELITETLTPHLAEQGRAILDKPLEPDSEQIILSGDYPFDSNAFSNIPSYGGERVYKYLRIEDELIGYATVTALDTGKIILDELRRGVHGTRSAYHKAGAMVHKLWYIERHYAAYFAGPGLLEPMSARIAEVINKTGLKLYAYDGLESWVRTGHDTLLASQFVLNVYNKLENKDDFQNEGSVITHFNWHLHNRLNWGEQRGSVFIQQQKYRWANQPFFARNLLPAALGAYFATEGDTTVEAEWVGSKVASFNAGFTLQENIEVFRSKPAHLAAIRRWITATEANAFSDTERFIMRDPDSRFHLEDIVANERWHLWDEAEDGTRSNPREITRQLDSHPTMNIAPSAEVSASSEEDNGYPADNVVDGYAGVEEDEMVHNRVSGVSEWASATDDANPWVALHWDDEQSISRVILFDRARLGTDTLGGILSFSDDTRIEIKNIPENGNGRHIVFPEKKITSVRFTLTDTKGPNPGLGEFVVIGRTSGNSSGN